MRKVRYIPEENMAAYKSLTINKVYDVIDYVDRTIVLLADDGVVKYFYMYSGYETLEFINVTHEYRNEIIDNILS